MAIKRGSKVDKSYSAASMTDLMFLLLMFMLIATTLINPNAIKVTLPKGANQLNEKAYTSVVITRNLEYYVETEPVSFDRLESMLRTRLGSMENPTISLHADELVDWGEIVKIIHLATKNGYRVIAATRAN